MSGTWAVARALAKEVLRMRLLVIFIIIILGVCTFGLALWLHYAPGLADEKIQTFLSYSLSFTTAVLSLITIFISIATITRDIKEKRIFTIATKPITRGGFLLGKLLGIALLNLMAIVIIGSIIYGLARLGQYTEPATEAERARLGELIFVARQGVKPPEPDLSSQVNEKVESIVAQKLRNEPAYRNNPELIRRLRESLTDEVYDNIALAHQVVPPGGHKVWHFTDIEPIDREKGYLFVRYKLDVSMNPADLALQNDWLIGPDDPLIAGGRPFSRRDSIRTFHEFSVPVSDLSSEGDIYVAYRNSPVNSPVSVIFAFDTGIEVLYVAGGFEANYLRTLALIYLRLLFLAVLALAIGTWLSFPVAVLLVLAIFVFGISSNFLIAAMDWEESKPLAAFGKAIIVLLPKFASYDGVPQIERGRFVSYDMLAQCAFFMILIKGSLFALFGYLVFKFRELARVIV